MTTDRQPLLDQSAEEVKSVDSSVRVITRLAAMLPEEKAYADDIHAMLGNALPLLSRENLQQLIFAENDIAELKQYIAAIKDPACLFPEVVKFVRKSNLTAPEILNALIEQAKDVNYVKHAYETIRVSEKAEYFVALCQLDDVCNAYHNFVMFGCVDGGKQHVLSTVGKNLTDGSLSCTAGLKVLCASKATRLEDEAFIKGKKIERSGVVTSIRYKAFNVSYQQYDQFTQRLDGYSMQPQFKYYASANQRDFVCAADKNLENEIQGSDVLPPVVAGANTFVTMNKLSINNTCRHSALEILQDVGINTEKMSTRFSSKLPHKMEIQHGKIQTSSLSVEGMSNEYYASQLNSYKSILEKELKAGCFWRLTTLNKKIKLSAVRKMIDCLLGKKISIPFQDLELKALRDGRLGKIVGILGRNLPGDFIKAEAYEAKKYVPRSIVGAGYMI